MRRLLPALLVLAMAAPAEAAPRPLVHFENDEWYALSGDLALYTRESSAFAVPVAGGAPRHVFTYTPPPAAQVFAKVAASPTRAAMTVYVDDDQLAQEFTGPPTGPWTPLGPPTRPAEGEPAPITQEVDGDRLFTLQRRDALSTSRFVVHDPQPSLVPFPTGDDTFPARFAGDLVAYATKLPGDDIGRRLVVREWRTGAQRTIADLPDGILHLDVRADGHAVASTADDDLYVVPPGGPARLAARRAAGAQFAGEHIVFRGDPGVNGGGQLRVLDPAGGIRAFGIPTVGVDSFLTDETRVLWQANDCLLVAEVTDAAVAEPGPGPCPRSEYEHLDPQANLRLGRRIAFRLRCVAGPPLCRGTVRLRTADGRVVSAPRRMTIPRRGVRRVVIKLGGRHLRALRRLVAREDDAFVSIEIRTEDGHRVRPFGADLLIEPARGA